MTADPPDAEAVLETLAVALWTRATLEAGADPLAAIADAAEHLPDLEAAGLALLAAAGVALDTRPGTTPLLGPGVAIREAAAELAALIHGTGPRP